MNTSNRLVELVTKVTLRGVVEFSAPRLSKSKKLPLRKPAKVASNPVLPPAPRKPGASAVPVGVAEAVNAPSRIKAPAKPKKRF